MHTYNDAIKDSLGSYILYPGNKPALFPSKRESIVGAFPLNPEPYSNEINEITVLINKKIDDLSSFIFCSFNNITKNSQ